MTRYDIRFLNHGGTVFGTDVMLGADDAEVIEKARCVHCHRIGKGYEIWDGERHVHTETYR